MPRVYEAGVNVVVDHFVDRIDGRSVTVSNVHRHASQVTLEADWVVMSTARTSVDEVHAAFESDGVSVETIGDATAPRSTYEAVYEGHRAARRLA